MPMLAVRCLAVQELQCMCMCMCMQQLSMPMWPEAAHKLRSDIADPKQTLRWSELELVMNLALELMPLGNGAGPMYL